jgi:hypothetical protein
MTTLARDPVLDGLQARLRELALEARASINEPPMSYEESNAEIEALTARAEIFWAIDDERRRRRPPRYECRRAIRAWEVGCGESFEEDEAARLARIGSLRLGIRSRHHSEEEAIEGSRGVKFGDLPIVEHRAAEIILGRRRAAKKKSMEPGSRIAKFVQSEWIAKVPHVRRYKREPGSDCFRAFSPIPIASIVRAVVPILDRLAGKPIASGIPTSLDLNTMKPAGIAALYAIIQLEYGSISIDTVYRGLLKFRREGRQQ